MSQLVGRKTFDLAGNECGAWAQPETDRVFGETLKRYLPASAIKELPYHINDAGFADACATEMIGMMRARVEHLTCSVRRVQVEFHTAAIGWLPSPIRLRRFA